uniref:RING-type domain-containing protein n=1 Tax=Panagrolaimus sp. ES5 TaxID=591445 RepID=A0AC34GQ73_9BILA
MNLYTAESSEVVRSTLRDEEHLNEIESSLSTLVHFLLRSHRRFVSQQWISTIARAFYYSATTVSGVQTIGEEYLGLVQMQGSNPRYIASDFQRFLSAAVETMHPVLITKLFDLLASYGDKLYKENHLHPGLYKLTQELPLLGTAFISFIKTFNIAIFYIFSTPYYDVSKAVADIKYRSIRPQANLQSQKLYKIMGIASLIRLLIVIKRKAERFAEAADDNEKESVEFDSQQQSYRFECSLCFDKAPPVSTPCGHQFCWNCIERTKKSCESIGVLQCPTCRFQFENNRVVPLMNL